MKAALRLLCRIICLILIAIGFFIGVVAGCAIVVSGLIWLQEGRLQPQDVRLLVASALWFAGAWLSVWVNWRLARLAGESDDYLRYRKSIQKSDGEGGKAWLVFLLLVLTPALWATLSGPSILRVFALAGWLIVAFLSLHLHILLHELGHLTAAWLMRFHLCKIQVGVGPVLWSGALANGVRFEWRAWSVGGFMMALNPAPKNFRLRQFLFIAAGPLAEVVILWAGYNLIVSGVFGWAALGSAGGLVVGLFLVWTALSLVGGITPRTAWLGDRKVWTDGYWLWLLLTGSDKQLAALTAQIRWRNALESTSSRELPSWFVPAARSAVPVNGADSLAIFRTQHLRLSSILLRRAGL